MSLTHSEIEIIESLLEESTQAILVQDYQHSELFINGSIPDSEPISGNSRKILAYKLFDQKNQLIGVEVPIDKNDAYLFLCGSTTIDKVTVEGVRVHSLNALSKEDAIAAIR